MLLLPGCWDGHEINNLFIVTGLALDTADDPEKIDITVQIGKTKPSESGTGGSDSGSATILVKTTSSSILEGLMKLNRDTSRTLLLQHNQVLLFGTDFARQGVEEQLDLFLRDQDARMELLVVVVDGRGEDALRLETDQEEISAVYLSRIIEDMGKISSFYKVRIFDFVSRLRDGSVSAVTPLIKLVESEGKTTVELGGMAVFRNDVMVGSLDIYNTLGYIMAMGDLKRCCLEVENEQGEIVFKIANLDTKRDVTLKEDGTVKVTLKILTTMTIGQISGFENMESTELMPYIADLAEKKIAQQISDTYETAKELNADIFCFATSVYRKYPREWEEMKQYWDELFGKTELDIQVEVHLPATGQIVESLEMGESE